jgi:6,7-dimethyl-8-ribityllumazine synthase
MKKIGIVVGQFHKEQCEAMVDEAKKTAEELGLDVGEVVWVPGSLEKPLALKRMLMKPDIAGAIALGIIEKGETSHGFVMGQAVTSAILAIEIDLMKPVGMGILGPDIMPSQIAPRIRPYARAAVCALAQMLGE